MLIPNSRSSTGRPSFELYTCILVAMVWYSGNARANAEASGTSMFSLSGFGTLGEVHSNDDRADFTSSIFKPNGAGFSHEWSADVDSLIGAQVTANFTPHLSAVVQAIAEQNYDKSYWPHVEWANIKYQFTPEFSIRFGRTVLPIFLHSETREVAYTYPWVRPPSEVYSLVPITTADGLDVSYHLHVGELTNTLQANFGKNVTHDPQDIGGGSSEATHLRGFFDTTEYGALTVRISYQTIDLTVHGFDPLFDAFRQFGAEGDAIADRYNLDAKSFAFVGVGVSYDPGDWFGISEWGRENSHSVFGNRNAWYASGGYRFGKFTPYVTYAQAKTDNLSDPGLTVANLPASQAGAASGLNSALDSILRGSKPVQNSAAVGGRWDFTKSVDVKVQYDEMRLGAGSNGVLSNVQAGFQPGGRVSVFSVALDFVF